MGLFIIAGILIVIGIVLWIIEENFCYKNWILATRIFTFVGGCAMMFVLLPIMGTNRANEAITNMNEDYTMCTLALEGCDTLTEYMAIADEINAYNNTVNQHRRMRENEMTNWLFSPKIAEMPLIVVPDFQLQEAE